MTILRDFQHKGKGDVYEAWSQPNVYNVMPVFPTGAGKTVIVGNILNEFNVPACAIAHRQELVAQMALALNRERVPHGIIAPKKVQKQIIALEHETHGHSDYAYRADVRVAGVDSLANHDTKDRWLHSVGLVVQDEGHHVLKDNKWGKAMSLFPNARGLFPTAHAIRADGCGLGRGADGLVDKLVLGPSCRELIDRGFLVDYRLLCPQSDIDFSQVPVGASGDYSLPKLRAATHSSGHIVGDVVRHYLKYAAGKLGITFAVDIEAAKEFADAYRKSGVPAEVITSKTPIDIRGKLMKKFRNHDLLQLVSVDCLGEGVDVPAVEVISMARKTASWQLFCQQFGRALRIMVSEDLMNIWNDLTDAGRKTHIAASAKPKAIIIDHVGNIPYFAASHGLPDTPQEYDLAGGKSRGRNTDAIPLRVCLQCLQPYERFRIACPDCGTYVSPPMRATPEMVDGDLYEVDPEVLRKMRGEVARIDDPMPTFPHNATGDIRANITRHHNLRQRGQHSMRRTAETWFGWRKHVGESDRESLKRFFLVFNIDYLSAQALNTKDATELESRITAQLIRHNIFEAAA